MSAPAETNAGTVVRIAPAFVGPIGAAAAVVYVGAVILGGLITPGFSHAVNAISELTHVEAPQRMLLSVLFTSYDALVVAFAISVPSAIGTKRRAVAIGALFLALVGLAGIGMSTLFPTDRPGDTITAIGWVHIALAGFASLGSMAAVLAFGLGLRAVPGWRRFAMFSFFSLAAIFTSGLWAATTAAELSPILGIAERVTIGIFMLWLFVFSLELILRRADHRQS